MPPTRIREVVRLGWRERPPRRRWSLVGSSARVLLSVVARAAGQGLTMILMAPLARSLNVASALSYSASGKWWVMSSLARIRAVGDEGDDPAHLAGRGPRADQLELVEHQGLALQAHVLAWGCRPSRSDRLGAASPSPRSASPARRRTPGRRRRRGRRSARGRPATGSPARVSTVSKPRAAARSSRWPRPTTTTRAAPTDERGVGGEQPDRACAGHRDGVAGLDVAAPCHVQRDAGGVGDGALVEAHLVGQLEDALDVVHGVGGVDALDVVPVLRVQTRACRSSRRGCTAPRRTSGRRRTRCGWCRRRGPRPSSRRSSAPSPRATISPAHSWPGVKGNAGGQKPG